MKNTDRATHRSTPWRAVGDRVELLQDNGDQAASGSSS
jgi:hypothetical protein